MEVSYGQLRRLTEQLHANAALFSPEEKVAERVLALLEAGHNVESVRWCLLEDLGCLVREGDEARVEVVRRFLVSMNG